MQKKISKKIIAISLLFVACVGLGYAFKGREAFFDVRMENLAKTPPMGWNGWNHFRCSDEVDEVLIKQTADAMVNTGMRDVGYEFVVLDDCWQMRRDGDGSIVPDPKKFPSGMKALGDYIHDLGLKFGIYTSAGRITCEGRPGSYMQELRDVKTYASWGVDYIKVDWCGIDYLDTEVQYNKWRYAIESAGRPMVLSIAIADIDKIEHNNAWDWGRGVGHLWRTALDIQDDWADMLRVADTNARYARYAGPGGWNDADMLVVGNGGMTDAEYQTHFSLWAMMASPLMAGNDIRTMTEEVRTILTNAEVIAINQDSFGQQGSLVAEPAPGVEVWLKPLAGDDRRAVLLVNRTERGSDVVFTRKDIGLVQTNASMRDVWRHEDLGIVPDEFRTHVLPHESKLYLITYDEQKRQ